METSGTGHALAQTEGPQEPALDGAAAGATQRGRTDPGEQEGSSLGPACGSGAAKTCGPNPTALPRTQAPGAAHGQSWLCGQWERWVLEPDLTLCHRKHFSTPPCF